MISRQLWSVTAYCRLPTLKNKNMLLNYLKLSLRLMLRNPVGSVVNIAGLTIGFTTFLLLWPYADRELKSDQYHRDAEKIVRLGVDFKWTDDKKNWNGFLGAFNSWGVAHQISQTFPKVEALTRLVVQLNYTKDRQQADRDLYISIIDREHNKVFYREAKTIFADTNFFQFFTIPLVAGQPQHVLTDANSVVLSESSSRKYFGEEEPIGKIIYLNDSLPVTVTGVFKNLPNNTHLDFDMVFSVAGKRGMDVSVWNGWSGYCYFKLSEGYSHQAFQQDLDHRKEALYDFVKLGCPHCEWNSLVQPLEEVVFSDYRGNSFRSKSKYLLEVLGTVAFLVLILGWINYTTLSIHQLNKRLRELAARSVVGAGKKEFFFQFLVEAFTINLVSVAAAFTLFQLLKAPFELWLGLYFPAWDDFTTETIVLFIVLFSSGILVTTLYPLLIIRKEKVGDLFKSSKSGFKHSYLNVSLVSLQYASAVVLLIWIAISNLQVSHLLQKDIGLKKDEVIVIEGSPRVAGYDDSRVTSFLQQAREIEGVDQATASYSLVGEPDVKGIVLQRKTDSNFIGVDTNGGVDENFLETFLIKLKAGRNFLSDNPVDRKSILISQALAHRLGFQSPEEALEQEIMIPEHTTENAVVIGVFSDYEFRPYFNDATEHNRGIVLMYKDYIVPNFKPLKLSLNIRKDCFQNIIEKVEQLHQSLFPDETFRWYWLDERIANQYRNERSTKNQLTLFTVLAVAIACLGLFGLISSKAVEKTKEIGIRKVLGANLPQIAQVLLYNTAKQVVLATIIGVPLAWHFSEQYLQKFSERIELQWWHYALPIMLLVLIMFTTVAAVVWKAAKNNPVEALKYE